MAANKRYSKVCRRHRLYTNLFCILVGAKFLNDMLEAPTYTLSVFNCHTKPCKWVEYPNQFHKRTECENAGKHTVDDIDEVKDYRCEE